MTYNPYPIGTGEVDPAAMDDELARISQGIHDAGPKTSLMWGAPPPMQVDGTPRLVVGYESGAESAAFVGEVDLVAGTVTVGEDGVYQINGVVIGEQGNNAQNTTMYLFFRVDGQDFDRAAYSIASPQTSVRSLQGNMLLRLSAGAVVAQGLRADSNLATFTYWEADLSVSKVQGI